jgi:LmbE family N-acetylglucosaminyl deacetylase
MSSELTCAELATRSYAHLVLSPHLDDAALSCGGLIARRAALGEPVLVVNVCSGSPPPGGPFSPFAAFQHTRWELPADEAVALRRAEDGSALGILGADRLQLGLLDAIYRMPEAYVDDATLFGPVAEADSLATVVLPALEALVAHFPDAVVYAPLGVGNHVDHQATFQVAAALADAGANIRFYEDFPYAARPGAVEARLAQIGDTLPLRPAAEGFDSEIGRKIASVAAYASQIATLFGDGERMEWAVAAYAASLAPEGHSYAERFWERAR